MIPNNQYFLTLDADGTHLSSDFYLRLAGAANQMLKGQIPLSLTVPIPNVPSGEAPYGGTRWNLPGTVQIENYDTGGQGVGYNKPTAGTSTLAYRSDEAAQIEATSDTGGGDDVGWTNTGDWYKYMVNVTAAGTYSVNVRVASPNATSAYHVEVDGTNVTSSVTVPNTGAWQTYTTLTKTGVNLTAGAHTLRLVVDNGGMNFNWLSVTGGSPTATPTVQPPTNTPSGTTTMFSTGLESGQTQPTWNNTVEPSNGGISNVGGICCSLTGPELGVRTETAHTGTAALLYSGKDNSATASFAYMEVFNVSIPVVSTTKLSYWIFPQSSATNGNVSGANSECVAIDMVFTDGTNLRDSGVTDQKGNKLHPASQCGKLTLDTWNNVTANLGSLAGKTIARINIGYDQAPNTGGYRGYVDDIAITQ